MPGLIGIAQQDRSFLLWRSSNNYFKDYILFSPAGLKSLPTPNLSTISTMIDKYIKIKKFIKICLFRQPWI